MARLVPKRIQRTRLYTPDQWAVEWLQLNDDINLSIGDINIQFAANTTDLAGIHVSLNTLSGRIDVYDALTIGPRLTSLEASDGVINGRLNLLESPAVSIKNANYAVVAADRGSLLLADTTAGAFTITANAVTLGMGFKFGVKRRDPNYANFCTITAGDSGADYINCMPNQTVWFESDGTIFHVVEESGTFAWGLNANGHWTRDATGWQECYNNMTIGTSTVWTYPQPFFSVPLGIWGTTADNPGTGVRTIAFDGGTAATTTTATFSRYNQTGTAFSSGSPSRIAAVGPWR